METGQMTRTRQCKALHKGNGHQRGLSVRITLGASRDLYDTPELRAK